MASDAVTEPSVNGGLGFIDKMGELVIADGGTVKLEGNDIYVNGSSIKSSDGANVIIEILVPFQVTSELSALDCQTLLSREDIICLYGSSQLSAEAMVINNEIFQKFGTGADQVIGVGFGTGAVINAAVADGTLIGAVTLSPVDMGKAIVELACKAAAGEEVTDVDIGCLWYTAENMQDPEIAQNLYD